jgi:Tol biopolymer transport system component
MAGGEMQYEMRLSLNLVLIGIATFLAACKEYPPIPMASDPTWSPDGQQIVYVCSDKTVTVDLQGPGSHTSDDDICVMNRDGTDRHYLVQQPDDDRYPRWSPNGNAIAFTSSGMLYVVDAGGGKPRQLFENVIEGPHWSPDGRQIAFVGRNDGGPYTIHIIDEHGEHLASLENPSRESLCNLQWSPDGNQIAYISTPALDCSTFFENNPYSLMIADVRDGFRARGIADNLPYIRDLVWVDRETLTYSNRLGFEGYALYRMDLKSGLQTRISPEQGMGRYAWTSDRMALAYTTSSDAVYVQDRLSSRASQVWKQNGTTVSHLEWSPDSQRLLVGVSEQIPLELVEGLPAYAETIWVISRDGKSAQRLTPLGPGEPAP